MRWCVEKTISFQQIDFVANFLLYIGIEGSSKQLLATIYTKNLQDFEQLIKILFSHTINTL